MRGGGYHQTTLREIAEAAIRKASLDHHFGAKEEIVEAVGNDGVRFVPEAVVATLAAEERASPRVRLEAAVRARLAALHGHGDYTSAGIEVFTFGAVPVPESARIARRAYEDVWRRLIAERHNAGGMPAGNSPDVLRLFLLGALNGSIDWCRPERHSIEAPARESVALLAPR